MSAANLRVVEHPLLEHSLTILRDQNTSRADFRHHAGVVSKVLLVDVTREAALADVRVTTPLAEMTGQQFADRIVVVPVLRAGLAMLMAAQDLLIDVSVGFMGLERDEETAVAREYYRNMPDDLASQWVIVLDPMLATGGSLDGTVCALKDKGAQRITLLCIVSAPEGIQRVTENHPDVTLITAAVDERLDANKFIVPGLGDFGDRYFGT